MLSPTPLWATIAAVLAAFLYTHIRMKYTRSFFRDKIKNTTAQLDEVRINLRKQNFDKEIIAYYDISDRLATIRILQVSFSGLYLNDLTDKFNRSILGEPKSRQEIISNLKNAMFDYNISINKHSISIKENIYDILVSIFQIVDQELTYLSMVGTITESRSDKELFSERIDNYTKITTKINEAQKMIRNRIDEIASID